MNATNADRGGGVNTNGTANNNNANNSNGLAVDSIVLG